MYPDQIEIVNGRVMPTGVHKAAQNNITFALIEALFIAANDAGINREWLRSQAGDIWNEPGLSATELLDSAAVFGEFIIPSDLRPLIQQFHAHCLTYRWGLRYLAPSAQAALSVLDEINHPEDFEFAQNLLDAALPDLVPTSRCNAGAFCHVFADGTHNQLPIELPSLWSIEGVPNRENARRLLAAGYPNYAIRHLLLSCRRIPSDRCHDGYYTNARETWLTDRTLITQTEAWLARHNADPIIVGRIKRRFGNDS